jgi:hypothetical protein
MPIVLAVNVSGIRFMRSSFLFVADATPFDANGQSQPLDAENGRRKRLAVRIELPLAR